MYVITFKIKEKEAEAAKQVEDMLKITKEIETAGLQQKLFLSRDKKTVRAGRRSA